MIGEVQQLHTQNGLHLSIPTCWWEEVDTCVSVCSIAVTVFLSAQGSKASTSNSTEINMITICLPFFIETKVVNYS